MSETLLQAMAQSVIDGEKELAEALAREALQNQIPPLAAISQGYVKGIESIGERFGRGDCFLPELVMAAEAMKAALEILEPELTASGQEIPAFGKAVAGTVKGDVHDIGKSIVCTMFTAQGFRVIDLGVDVSPEQFVQAVQELHPDLVLLSALLTTTLPNQRKTIQALAEAGLRDRVKVLVGGAPASQEWADSIQADGYGANAIEAVNLAMALLDAPA